jgi:hypothetical protein
LAVPFRYPKFPTGSDPANSYDVAPLAPLQKCAIPGDFNKINYVRQPGTTLGIYVPLPEGQAFTGFNNVTTPKTLLDAQGLNIQLQKEYASGRNFPAYRGLNSSETVSGFNGVESYDYTTPACGVVWNATQWAEAQPTGDVAARFDRSRSPVRMCRRMHSVSGARVPPYAVSGAHDVARPHVSPNLGA